MSLSQTLLNILSAFETIFQAIDGGSDYHNTLLHSNIYKKHKSFDEVASYPAISISSIGCTGSKQTDQVTYEGNLQAEIFGYVMDEGNNLLETTLKLAEDMEKAIYLDEDLSSSYVGELSLDITTATMDSYGLVRINLRSKLYYINS